MAMNPPSPERHRSGAESVLNSPVPASPQSWMIGGTLLVSLLLWYSVWFSQGSQQSILYGLGILLGYSLFHARFGFTSAFRQFLSVGQGVGIRAHMLMLAVACTLFAPILATGTGFFGVNPAPSLAPLGTSVVAGAFIFGIGMQLGGGCASGTLYALGGGRSSAFITLLAFIAGSVIGAWHWDFWVNQTPSLPPVSLAETTGWGYGGAWMAQMILFAAVAGITWAIARKRRPPIRKPLPTAQGWIRIFRGSWPLWVAAIALAVLNAATLLTQGKPWGITSAFALWGSKAALALGIDVTQWAYWSGDRANALHAPVLADSTSVMNFGIILGAALASAAGGTFILRRIPIKTLLASVIGGLLMGYGARLAYGCNIGAYFSGVASFSLHGWLWMVMALIGSMVGLYLRPFFGMSNPKPDDSVC
ncbi:YeeE/YedE family protein [Kroppenstedtia pulmonis]|nr:YeeE/YedE family protein [Kroppenstedtia pulmonis]